MIEKQVWYIIFIFIIIIVHPEPSERASEAAPIRLLVLNDEFIIHFIQIIFICLQFYTCSVVSSNSLYTGIITILPYLLLHFPMKRLKRFKGMRLFNFPCHLLFQLLQLRFCYLGLGHRRRTSFPRGLCWLLGPCFEMPSPQQQGDTGLRTSVRDSGQEKATPPQKIYRGPGLFKAERSPPWYDNRRKPLWLKGASPIS